MCLLIMHGRSPLSDHALAVKVVRGVMPGHKCLSWSTIFPNPPPRTVCLIHKCLQVNLVCSSALHRLFKLLHWSGLRCCKTDFDTTRTGCSALLTSSECSIVNLSPLTMMNMSMRTSNFWCYLVQLLGVLCNCADLYGNVQARSGMYVLHMVQ